MKSFWEQAALIGVIFTWSVPFFWRSPAAYGAEDKQSVKTDSLKKALVEYQKGAYLQASNILNSLPAGQKNQANVVYWSGMCDFKMQKYPEAAKSPPDL